MFPTKFFDLYAIIYYKLKTTIATDTGSSGSLLVPCRADSALSGSYANGKPSGKIIAEFTVVVENNEK